MLKNFIAINFSFKYAFLLRTNFASRRTLVRLRVTHGKPWLSLSVLNIFFLFLILIIYNFQKGAFSYASYSRPGKPRA